MTEILKFKSSLVRTMREYDWNKLRWRNLDRKKLYLAFRSMLHPLKVFEEVRIGGAGSVMIASALFLLNFLVQVFSYSGVGFIFNMNRPEDFNIWLELFKSNFLIVLWCVANWATTTLLNGEGKFSHIWIVTNYAMLPRIIFTPLVVLFSNVLCVEEMMFFTMFSSLTTIWVFLILFTGLIVVHQFTLVKTLASSVLSVISIVFFLFIALLFVSIAQQVVLFIKTIASEFILRI